MIRRFLAVLHARNMEFIRDRSSLSWNLLVPALLVAGMAWIFGGEGRPMFKVAVIQQAPVVDVSAHPFLATRHVEFYATAERGAVLEKVKRHQVDMVLELGAAPAYWVNSDSPNGYVLERMLLGTPGPRFEKSVVHGEPIRYIDWLVPGILGMNMMFSCLFGVGYVVVRYRKNGFLKRLSATPLRAIEFVSAQIASRLLITLASLTMVFAGTKVLLGIRMEGSYLVLLLVAALGASSLIALSLLIASRVTSEELAGGLLNFLGWPMMLLSGVWFSLEGSNQVLQSLAKLLPLTHMLQAARAVMIDGEGLDGVILELTILAAMAAVCMVLAARLFKWRVD